MIYKSIFIFILTSLILTSAKAQEAEIIKWDRMESILNPESDTTYVINFWATWCIPCVKELPYFDLLADTLESGKLKVYLISRTGLRGQRDMFLFLSVKNKADRNARS